MAERTRRRRRLPAAGRRLGRRLAGFSPAVYSVAFLVAALIGAVIYTLVQAGSPRQLSVQLLGYRLHARPGAVSVRFQVHKAPLAEARCSFVVYDRYEDVIGTASATIGPNTRSLATTDHALLVPYRGGVPVSAVISSCRITRNH